MGFFDSLKDFAGSAQNALEEQKKKQAEMERRAQSAGTLRPNATVAPSQPAQAKTSVSSGRPTDQVYTSASGLVTRKWGTMAPIPYNDYSEGYRYYVRVSGDVEFTVADPEKSYNDMMFLSMLLDTVGHFLNEQSLNMVPVNNLKNSIHQLGSYVDEKLQSKGIKIEKLMVVNLNADPAKKDPIKEVPAEIAAKMNLGAATGSGVSETAPQAAPSETKPKFCTSCGAPTANSGKFCSNCGAPLC